MKNTVYLIILFCVLFACTKDEVEEIEDFAGDSGTFTDLRDNHVYNWIRIGDKIWMAENLAFIPSVYPSDSGSYTGPRYYVYGYSGNDVEESKRSDNYIKFGVLYNWPAARAASPSGWHLPSDEEWKQLELFLGMTDEQVIATGWRGNEESILLKANRFWNSNGAGIDSVGFAALPGGLRGSTEGFLNIGISGYWWSATENSPQEAWDRGLYWSIPNVNRYHMNKDYGLSVRCVKD